PLTGLFDVADTTVAPADVGGIVTEQLAVAAPPVYVQVGDPTKLPRPLTIDAGAVCGPAPGVPPSPLPVTPATCSVPSGMGAVGGLIWMFASTEFLFALPEFGATPSVSRCNVTPATVTSVVACTTVAPTEDDVICTVQEPVPPEVVQLFTPPTKLPGPETIEKLITVPFGAFEKVTPSCATFTCPVSV